MGAIAVRNAGPGAVAVATGCALLAARASFPGFRSAPALAALFGFVLATGLALPDGPRRRLIHPATVTAAGCAAAFAVRALSGPSALPSYAAGAIALTLIASVAEEALFRRALYGMLARRNAAAAVAVSASAFALTHVPLYGVAALPAGLGAGLLLSWQRWASGRWESAAATHAFANVLAYLP